MTAGEATAFIENEKAVQKARGRIAVLREIEAIIDQRLRLEALAGEMFATIKLNYERGYLAVNVPAGAKPLWSLEQLIAGWQRQLEELS